MRKFLIFLVNNVGVEIPKLNIDHSESTVFGYAIQALLLKNTNTQISDYAIVLLLFTYMMAKDVLNNIIKFRLN